MTNHVLDAWLYGTLVARIQDDRGLRLEWTADALSRWGHASSVVSGLLPMSPEAPSPAVVRAWLRGLLPEGRARTRLALNADVDPDDVLGFLAVYGRDTAGALVLVPTGQDPTLPDTRPRPLSADDIGRMIDDAADLGAADQLSSLGGLEAKVVLTRTPDGWGTPTPRAPSTHIVKLSRPPESRSADLIDTENAALELARLARLGDVDARLVDFAGRRTIVVERYDRSPQPDGTVERLHQEDTAQLLGLDTSDPSRKFQYGRALPSLRAVAAALERLGIDLAGLVARMTFTVAIGDTDAHAKNLSVLHDEAGTHRLAPPYDVAFHTHHSHADGRFAMDVAGRRGTAEVTGPDLLDEAGSWRLTRRQAVRVVTATLESMHVALTTIDHAAHPGVTAAAWEAVDGRVRRLLDELAAVDALGRS